MHSDWLRDLLVIRAQTGVRTLLAKKLVFRFQLLIDDTVISVVDVDVVVVVVVVVVVDVVVVYVYVGCNYSYI